MKALFRRAVALPSNPGRMAAVVLLSTAALAATVVQFQSRNAHGRLTWDDAYILMAAARTLTDHGKLSIAPDADWFAGVTSPLYVAVLSGWSALFDREAAARLVGYAAAGALLILCVLLAGATGGRHSLLGPLSAGLFLALGGQLALVAVSGMETALFGLLMVAFLWLYGRYGPGLRSGAAAAALVLCRPEGIVLGAVALLPELSLLLRERRIRREAIAFALCLAAACGAWAATNFAGGGRLTPWTAHAKMYYFAEICETFGSRLQGFASSLLAYFRTMPAVVGLGLLGSVWPPATGRVYRDLLAPFSLTVVALTFFTFPLSGPVAYQGRYFFPIYVSLVLMASLGIGRLGQALGTATGRTYIGVIAQTAVLVAALYSMREERKRLRAFHENAAGHHENLFRQALWFRENTPTGTLVSVTDLGVMLYYSQRPVVDLVGLARRDMIGYYRKPDGSCVHPRTRNLDDVLDRFRLDYLVVAPPWDSAFMGDYVKRNRARLEAVKMPGYSVYRVRRAHGRYP